MKGVIEEIDKFRMHTPWGHLKSTLKNLRLYICLPFNILVVWLPLIVTVYCLFCLPLMANVCILLYCLGPIE